MTASQKNDIIIENIFWEGAKMLSFCLSMIDNPVAKLHFEDLYYKYKIEVMRYALTLTKNHHDAEEICQEAWFVVANQFDTLKDRDDTKIKAYIIKTVKNMSFDCLREREKRGRYLFDDNIENLDITTPNFLDSVLLTVCQNETVETICNCINLLDEIYRDVLDLYYINQSSPKDIAEFLNIDVKTARKRIERGRAMLINMLIRRGEGNGDKV